MSTLASNVTIIGVPRLQKSVSANHMNESRVALKFVYKSPGQAMCDVSRHGVAEGQNDDRLEPGRLSGFQSIGTTMTWRHRNFSSARDMIRKGQGYQSCII